MIGPLLLLLMLPFALFSDWMGFIARQPPPQQELARASHGAALAIMVPLLTHLAVINGLIRNADIVWPIALAIAAFGVFWLVTGVARSKAFYRDSRLLARAGIKIGIAVALVLVIANWPEIRDQLPRSYYVRHYLFLAIVYFLIPWCAITGVTKFLILLRGPPEFEEPSPGKLMPHGDADFDEGGGLGGDRPAVRGKPNPAAIANAGVLGTTFKTRYRKN